MDIIRDLCLKEDGSIFIQTLSAFICRKEFDKLCSGVGISGGFMVEMRKIVHMLEVRRLLAHSLPKTDCSTCQERRSVLLMYVNVWQQQNRNMMKIMMVVIVVMIPPVSISVA
jgi:hypothetical protein